MSDEREVLFHADRKDFRIDTYRGTGPGGQHRNKTDSCVRITHIESGLSAECCESRSQHQNRGTAFRRLAAKLVEHYVPKRRKERNASGTIIIRTYHAVDNRVKDHASGLQQSYQTVLDDPADMIAARAACSQEQQACGSSGRLASHA
jgi:protein subunit release factor A